MAGLRRRRRSGRAAGAREAVVNLSGGGWPNHFYAGGRIDAAGVDVARIQLRFANGVTLEDDAEAGVALFITERAVELPGIAILLDGSGRELSTDEALPSG